MMWQRVALCVAGLGAITVSAALADDTTPIANQDAPQGAFVAYLDDDPPDAPDAPDAQAPSAQAATAQAAGRVLRMLEILGVHRPQPMPAPVLAATDVPPPPASETPQLETAAPFAYQEDAGRSLYEANAPGDDDRFPLVAASPDSSEPNEDWASSWQINDLRDPARTRTDWLHDEGLRDRVGLETDAVASSGEANAGPARQLANSATPAPPIRCPDGMKSSRRTFQQAGAGTTVAQAPAAEPPAVIAPRTTLRGCRSGASARSHRQVASGGQRRSRRGAGENVGQRRIQANGHAVAQTPTVRTARTGIAAATGRGEPAAAEQRRGRSSARGHAVAVAQHAPRSSSGQENGLAAADRFAVAAAITIPASPAAAANTAATNADDAIAAAIAAAVAGQTAVAAAASNGGPGGRRRAGAVARGGSGKPPAANAGKRRSSGLRTRQHLRRAAVQPA